MRCNMDRFALINSCIRLTQHIFSISVISTKRILSRETKKSLENITLWLMIAKKLLQKKKMC